MTARHTLLAVLACLALGLPSACSAGSGDLSTDDIEDIREHVRSIELDISWNLKCGNIRAHHARCIDAYGDAGWAVAEQEMQDPEVARELRDHVRGVTAK